MTVAFFICVAALVALVRGQDNCNAYNTNMNQCVSSISTQNNLFCEFLTNTVPTLCVKTTKLCTPCQMPQNGVCTAQCSTACASAACSDSKCGEFLAGWSSLSCMRFSAGGLCSPSDCAISGASMHAQCSTTPTQVVATCGSDECRRTDSCVPGTRANTNTSALVDFCFVSGQRECSSNQRCGPTGACVAKTVCDDIDRQSDCELVMAPGNNRPCQTGVDGCSTPVGSTITISNQAGCNAAQTQIGCQSSTCSRNNGKCVWIDFRPGSSKTGMCACPRDCPTCATMVGGRCMYDCSVRDGCFGELCPQAFKPSSSCFFPSANSQVMLGDDSGSCKCHTSPPADCGSEGQCDVAGNCGTKTLCAAAFNVNDCNRLTCAWDNSTCLWTGTECRCANAVPSGYKLVPTIPPYVPAYVLSSRYSSASASCVRAVDCPPLRKLRLHPPVLQRNAFELSANCVDEEKLSTRSADCGAWFNNDGTARITLQLASPSTLRGIGILRSSFGVCVPVVWATVGSTTKLVIDSTNSSYGSYVWVVYELSEALHGVTSVFVWCQKVDNNRIYVGVGGFRLLGWSDEPSERVVGWNSSMLNNVYGMYVLELAKAIGSVSLPSTQPATIWTPTTTSTRSPMTTTTTSTETAPALTTTIYWTPTTTTTSARNPAASMNTNTRQTTTTTATAITTSTDAGTTWTTTTEQPTTSVTVDGGNIVSETGAMFTIGTVIAVGVGSAIGAAALVLAILGVVIIIRRRRTGPSPPPPSVAFQDRNTNTYGEFNMSEIGTLNRTE